MRLLIDTFLKETAEKLDRLATLGVDKSSSKEAVRLAHSLKSASAMAGAMALSNTAARLEFALEHQEADVRAKDVSELVTLFVGYHTQLQQRGLAAAA